MKNKTHYRQGDVLIVPVSEIPAGLTRTKRVTLALGEVTGHHHTISEAEATGYGTAEDALATYFESSVTMTLTHQEHNPVVIPPGKYQAIRQVEYTPEEIKNVAD